MIGVYAVVNEMTGRMYIGSSRFIERRFIWHKKALYRGNHYNKFLQEDFDLHGLGIFKFVVLEEISDDCNLESREQFYIDQNDCYNTRPATIPPLLGKHHNERSKRLIGDKLSVAMIGKSHSEEWRQRQSQMMKGNTFARNGKGTLRTPEQRANMSAGAKVGWKKRKRVT